MALASQTEWLVTATRSHLEVAGLQVQQGKGASYHQATRRQTGERLCRAQRAKETS